MFYCVPPSRLALTDGEQPLDLISTRGTPMFIILIALEYVGMSLRSPDNAAYRANDTLASISSGISQQLFGQVLQRALPLSAPYEFVYRKYRLVNFDVKRYPITTWLALLLGVDLAYYWGHRLLHVFHAGWSAHSVHHSGEDYNLATALRQGSLQSLFTWILNLPMALVFPPASFAMHVQLNTLYQFWIHTELVGRLGPLEYILNTPFHHRMHHRPPGNCNYAGVLIIWDRLFGTYQTETKRLDYYGLAASPGTFDPIYLNLQHWRKIFRLHIEKPEWLPLLFRRLVAVRTKHRFSCWPQALVQPFEPVSDGGSSWALPHGPLRRPKFDGARLLAWKRLAALFSTLIGFATLRVLIALRGRSTPLRRVLLAYVAGALSLSAMGSFLDTGNVPRFASTNAVAVCVLALASRTTQAK